MPSQTTATGYAIVKEAAKYITPDDICHEEAKNTSACIMKLKQSFGDANPNEAYCAITAWVIVQNAMNNIGMPNLLPKTKGALDMRNRSVGKLKTNTNPNIGSVFYRKSTDPKSSGHIGIVVQTDKDVFHTIEGNAEFYVGNKKYEGVWAKYYPYSDISKRGFTFIHTEQMNGDNKWFDFEDLFQKDIKHSGTSQPNSTFFSSSIISSKNTFLKVGIVVILLGTSYYYLKSNGKLKKLGI